MEKNSNQFAVVVFLLSWIFILSSTTAFGQMSGKYTIDAKSPASKTNYRNFTSFFGDLFNGNRTDTFLQNGPTIGGAITVEVVKGSGPYEERVYVQKYIGASAQNSIVIDGNGETIFFDYSSGGVQNVFQFTYASYITLRNLNINLYGPRGGFNVMVSSESSHLTFDNCGFRQDDPSDNAYYSAFIALNSSALGPVFNMSSPGKNVTIQNCNLSNSGASRVKYGIYLGMDNQDTTDSHIIIRNNKIEDFTTSGIFGVYSVGTQVVGNEISNNSFADSKYLSSAIHIQNPNHKMSCRIDSNYIHDLLNLTNSTTRVINVDGSASFGNGDVIVEGNQIYLDSVFRSTEGIYCYLNNSKIEGDFKLNRNEIFIKQVSGYSGSYYGIRNYLNTVRTLNSTELMANKIEIWGSSSTLGIDHTQGKPQNLSEVIVANNIVRIFGTSSINCIKLNSEPGTILRIYYNTIVSEDESDNAPQANSRYLLYSYNGIPDITNNLFYGNVNKGTLYALYISGTQNFDCDFNNVFVRENNDGRAYFGTGSSTGTAQTFDDFLTKYSGGNDINVDPKFVDLEEGDFTPTNSYALDYGTPVNFITTDINGKQRSSTEPDMGAVEVKSSNIALPAIREVKDFDVFPNPSGQQITLQRKEITQTWDVVVYDALGKEVHHINFPEGLEFVDDLLPDLQPGLYILKGGTEEKPLGFKLIVRE